MILRHLVICCTKVCIISRILPKFVRWFSSSKRKEMKPWKDRWRTNHPTKKSGRALLIVLPSNSILPKTKTCSSYIFGQSKKILTLPSFCSTLLKSGMNQQEKHQHFTWHGRASFFFYVEDGGFSSSSTSNASWRYSFWMDVVWTENLHGGERKKDTKKKRKKNRNNGEWRTSNNGWVKGSDWNSMAQPGGVDEVGRDALKPSPPVFLLLD